MSGDADAASTPLSGLNEVFPQILPLSTILTVGERDLLADMDSRSSHPGHGFPGYSDRRPPIP